MSPTTERVGPTPGTWHLDPLHSSLIFVARYLSFGRVQGTFGQARGTVEVAEDPAGSTVEVTVETSSVNTGVAARDAHLRSSDFLDSDTYPELHFRSTALVPNRRKENAFTLHGELTVHGTTRPVSMPAQWVGEAPDLSSPDDIYGHFFSANTQISLSDFGVDDGGPLSWGGRLVGDTVDVVLEVRLQDTDPTDFLREVGHID
ncbi:YceI family protein [Nocardiopsis sp. HNM0947]|uniref:YceI family protein n=1 Tax=Nocardiopsis coralli TaxID=2772213 RepID=A0ABR9PBB7_9ACTN|nr:YceI family protein [Nocardiopsis coralli]MBE3001135.1 YceI family protein [Nocardiopsis coralli]